MIEKMAEVIKSDPEIGKAETERADAVFDKLNASMDEIEDGLDEFEDIFDDNSTITDSILEKFNDSYDVATDIVNERAYDKEAGGDESILDKLNSLMFDDSLNETTDLDINDSDESEYPSSYKERLDRTPSENSDRGKWTGERGESTYIPSDKEIQDLLAQFGLEGIEYEDAIPDFSQCSACTVEIDHMSEKRYGEDGNFAQSDAKCAEQWNQVGKDGKTDWTARDVKTWREENGYSWHERNDMKTCDLIPTKINDYFGHLGGVAECKKCDATQTYGGDFDE